MRFSVTRTSQWNNERPPCPEASLGRIEVWDARNCASPEEFDQGVATRFPKEGKWGDRGTEHQTVRRADGSVYIKRRLDDRNAWFVEIASLEDLIEFAERHGEQLVVSADPPSIEIYDGYRE